MKRDVYNGYEEYYMTGFEIIEFFDGCYETYGKHHCKVADTELDFDEEPYYLEDFQTYRLFINSNFCSIFDADTDEKIYFFGYIRMPVKST